MGQISNSASEIQKISILKQDILISKAHHFKFTNCNLNAMQKLISKFH